MSEGVSPAGLLVHNQDLTCLPKPWSFWLKMSPRPEASRGVTQVFLLCLQSWDIFFRNTNAGAPPGTAYQSPLPLSPGSLSAVARAQPLVGAQPNVDKLVEDHLAVQSLIRAYQVRGWRPTRHPRRGCCRVTSAPPNTRPLSLWGRGQQD